MKPRPKYICRACYASACACDRCLAPKYCPSCYACTWLYIATVEQCELNVVTRMYVVLALGRLTIEQGGAEWAQLGQSRSAN